MIFRVGFLVVASVSVFALTRVNIDLSRRRHISTKTPKNDNCTLQHEEIQEKDKFEDSNLVEAEEEEEEVTSNRRKTKQDLKQNYLKSSDCMSFESRIYDEKRNNFRGLELLKNQVKDMEQRRVILEVRLLELHGLREQQINFVQLKSQLEAKVEEIDKLNVTVDALEAEKKNLHEEIKQNHLAEKQIKIATKRMVEMQAKLRADELQIKGQLMLLKEQVCGLEMEMEKRLVRDANVESKFRAVKGLEIEVVEMKRRNKELQLEKRELAVKLTALSNMTESKMVADIEAEISSLRIANEELSKQVDKLQGNRFGMVDELMYQRCLNSCLRFETQNSSLNAQWKTSKTHKVMTKNLSSKCNKKRTKQLSLDSILGSISAHSSSSDSDEKTGSTIDDSSSSSQKSVRKKSSLIHKIKRWGRSKDDTSRAGLIRRRFSMSMVPLNTSMIQNGGENVVKDPETTLKRVRRVSFSDSVQSVESTLEVRPKCVQGVLDNDQTSNKRMGNRTMMNTSNGSTGKLEGEESEFSSPTFSTVIRSESSSNLLSNQDVENENKGAEIQVISKSDHIGLEEPAGMPNVPQSEKQLGAQDLVHLLVAFFFLLLILLVCFIIFTASAH